MMKRTRKNSVMGLMILFIGLLANNSAIAMSEVENTTYVKIMVDGMSCPFCAYGLEKYFKEVDGANDIFISVEDGFISFNIPSDKLPEEKELKQVIKDAGFTPGEVYFSDQPIE